MPPIQRYCDLTSEQQEVNERIMEELDNLKEQEMAIRNRCKSEAEARSNQELLKLDAVIMALQTFAQELTDAPELLLQSDSEMARDYYIPSANPKLDMLEELVEEILDSDEKVTIFSRYERMQSIIKDRLQKLDKNMKFAIVNGKIKGEKRYDEVYNKFRDKEEYKILLMTDAGAEGLNLSHCKYIIEYDLADSYAIQTQRHGRIERADSIHNTVFVYQLIANDSWDTIQQKIVSKKESYDAEIVKSLAKGGQL
jgi:superfamily II DNA/RNA helicase